MLKAQVVNYGMRHVQERLLDFYPASDLCGKPPYESFPTVSIVVRGSVA